ncbi:hypothetical protein J4446_03085 [Candidatus Woesearchaeota archaeon]|nr:hypothetical protein [Candidatus Woesearchaeota archaeon]
MNNKLIIVLIAILLIIPMSFAFELNSNELTRTTCQGSTILFTASVFGTGNFNVNLDGSASSWSTAVPQGFILNNNARTVYIYSTPNNNVYPGTYSLNLIVSNGEETKTIPYTINVENCHNLQITGETYKETCKGQITSFIYSLTNLGNYEEIYQLGLEAPDFLTLSQDLISLSPGESKNAYVYASQNSESTQFTLSAFNNNGIGEITSRLQVNSCYDFTVSTDKDLVNFCEHSTESVNAGITNVGINKDSYNLQIEGPAWANLDKQSLILNPSQSGNTNIVLTPDYGVKGNFDINLIVNTNEISKRKTLKAQVNKCHDVFLDIEEKEISLCNNAKVPLIIKNTGSFEKEFRLETSEQWVGMDNYQVKLQPGEEFTTNIYIDITNLEKINYDVFVRAIALDSSELSVDDKIKVNVLDEMQCHNTEIISDNNIKVTQGSSTTLPVTIKNEGNEKLVYEISMTGDGSSFTQLNPSILELNPDSAETIYLYSAPSTEVNPGDYSVDVRVSYNNNLLNSKNININVKESEFNQKEYVPLILRISNFLKNLFPKRIAVENQSEFIKEENIKEEIINEEPPENIVEINEVDFNKTIDANKTSFVSGLYNQVKSYWLYVAVGIAIIIILIIIFSAGNKEEDDEFDEEEEEVDFKEKNKKKDKEEEKPLKIGRWILGVIVILGLIYSQMKLKWISYIVKYASMLWSYVIIYKFYVLIGLILLLIVILIIKYWGSILEFFEEEEKPKKKKRKKK